MVDQDPLRPASPEPASVEGAFWEEEREDLPEKRSLSPKIEDSPTASGTRVFGRSKSAGGAGTLSKRGLAKAPANLSRRKSMLERVGLLPASVVVRRDRAHSKKLEEQGLTPTTEAETGERERGADDSSESVSPIRERKGGRESERASSAPGSEEQTATSFFLCAACVQQE